MATNAATKSRTNKAAAAPVEAPAAEAPKKETESQKRNRLRNEAERIIINRYKPEFEEVATKLFADNGLKFNKRMNEEQKAKAKIDELIAKHPELKDALLASLIPAQPEAAAAPAEDQGGVPALAEPVYAAPSPEETAAEGYGEDQFVTQSPAGEDPWAGR